MITDSILDDVDEDDILNIEEKVQLVKLKARNNVTVWNNEDRLLHYIQEWLTADGFYAVGEVVNYPNRDQQKTLALTHIGYKGSMPRSKILDFIERFNDYGELSILDRSNNMDFVHMELEFR